MFIKYTQQREEFLKSIVDGIQTINDKLLTFFVDCESEERVAEQIDIIENSKNLLGAGSK
ncbi:hypothetical protein HYO65_gp152 [Tenacibaculum phage PTm1]|uniref:Uncharacterized protein n=1 Tax=Tenacibaculum phage PTm1 TaxID=2547425 RepID=A0A5S9HXK8_9CAUD|nr:hypothetical protein HYO65_gp152 [Tenacibaculum phage PTm1]BBI90544.1 hypothetical protein [Tenacibaculum phage PTm1]